MSPTFDSHNMMRAVQEQTMLGPRRAGSSAGQKQEQALCAKLLSFGIENVYCDEIPVVHWQPDECRLEIHSQGKDSRELACFPIPFAAFTGKPKEGRLIHADHFGWQLADWRDKIVVAPIRFPMLDAKMLRAIALGEIDSHDTLKDVKHEATWIRLGWHYYLRAAKKRALGFIGVLCDQPGGSYEMYAPYGFREENILDKAIPGVWVSRECGDDLFARAANTHSHARLFTSGVQKPSVSRNIVAEIPGTSSETVVLTCHHDSPFTSPVEDASGVAVVLAIAEYLTKNRLLKRRVLVLLTAGHFYGSIGTRSFIEKHRQDLLPHIALVVSIEHIAREAVENAAGKLVPSGRAEAAGVFLNFNRILRNTLLEVAKAAKIDRWLLLPAEGPLGNYPPTDAGDWYLEKVPIINYISNPVYLLTSEDGESWVDKDQLPRVAQAFTELLLKLDKQTKADLSRCNFPLRRLIMKILRVILHAKTTRFGTRPLH